MSATNYEGVIGLEIHAKIDSASKMFCRCANHVVGSEPNTAVCPICLGFPGMLPALNAQAVRLGVRTALALGCVVKEKSYFDRKNYFYPDLPKGYQITQQYAPVAEKGALNVWVGDVLKTFRITRLHLEEDSGKLWHTTDTTICDYNRSGCPLMEIVTQPDFRSGEEASSFLKELQLLFRYIGTSTGELENGEMRCDVNVSVRPVGQETLGTKVEIKNMNSFNAIERAINYEIARQSALLQEGRAAEIVQETRGWDEVKEETYAQRTKEESSDYRYFQEPDLPPLLLTVAEIEQERAQIPELPATLRGRLMNDYGLKNDEARILATEVGLAPIFEQLAQAMSPAKAATWLLTVLLAFLKKDNKPLDQLAFSWAQLSALQQMVEDGIISFSAAKDQVFPVLYATGRDPEGLVDELNLRQVSDTGAIEVLIRTTVQKFPQQLAEYQGGKVALWGFFVGQVMKESKGQANPHVLQEVLKKVLEEK